MKALTPPSVRPTFGSLARSTPATTSAAVTGVPSEKPDSRSVMVTDRWSSAISHFDARSGSGFRSGE